MDTLPGKRYTKCLQRISRELRISDLAIVDFLISHWRIMTTGALWAQVKWSPQTELYLQTGVDFLQFSHLSQLVSCPTLRMGRKSLILAEVIFMPRVTWTFLLGWGMWNPDDVKLIIVYQVFRTNAERWVKKGFPGMGQGLSWEVTAPSSLWFAPEPFLKAEVQNGPPLWAGRGGGRDSSAFRIWQNWSEDLLTNSVA